MAPSRPTSLAVIENDLAAIKGDISEIKADLRSHYAPLHEVASLDMRLTQLEEVAVTQTEFWPIKYGFYGGVGLALTAVVGAVLALVVIARVP